MKKRIIVYGGLAVFISVFFGGYFLARNGVTRGNLDRIEAGMSKEETHRILGGAFRKPDSTTEWPWGKQETWMGFTGAIIVVFDHDEKLTYKEWDETRRHITFPERLCRKIWREVRE